ncbi:MAG: peptide-methionine (S)-S-oxide reductase MsrA [Ignavibacteriaceae bacterium]
MKQLLTILITTAMILSVGCRPKTNKITKNENVNMSDQSTKLDTATFGEGCFWCTEAVFERLKGVKSVISGYSGGTVPNPTYEAVCSGKTGHAEVSQIVYDPNEISYEELLIVFFRTHDPTSLNRQGADTGTQYRSVIFYHNEKQKDLAEFAKKKINEEKLYDKPIVTEISPLKVFYQAENYHQDYYNNNPNQGYCVYVIAPKLEKFEKLFKDKLKK